MTLGVFPFDGGHLYGSRTKPDSPQSGNFPPIGASVKTSERGYGWKHQKARRALASLVESGNMACARCGELISAGEPWDLGHALNRPTVPDPPVEAGL